MSAELRAAGMYGLLLQIRGQNAAREMDEDLLDMIDRAIADHESAKETPAPTATVYLVQTLEYSEAPSLIEAHLTMAAASARVDVLNAHADNAPLYPALDAPDEEFDSFVAAEAFWRAAHPLGPEVQGYLQQRYVVCTVPLFDSRKE